jgi:periplasmic divalent cation tolerance protein
MSSSEGEGGAGAVQVALVTAPDVETAAAIGRALVEERLAACVNVVPGVRSIYRFEGAVHDEGEALLIVKTRASLGRALEERVRALHPYQVPEVLRLEPKGGSAPYLAWVLAETGP